MLSEQLQVCLKELAKLTQLVDADGERQAAHDAQLKSRELAVQGREDKLNGIVNGYQKMIADLRTELKIAKESANKSGLEKQALERELKQLKKGAK